MKLMGFSLCKFLAKNRAELVSSAQARLLVYAPGLSPLEIKAILHAKKNIRVENIYLYLDVSDSSFANGYWYGQYASELSNLVSSLNIHQAHGARLGLLIVDDTALIFSPPVSRLEAELETEEANCIRLNSDMTEMLWQSILVKTIDPDKANEILSAEQQSELETIIKVPDRPIVDQQIIETITDHQELETMISPDMERFLIDLRRQVKLVRLSLEGSRMEQSTVSLTKEINDLLGSDSKGVNKHFGATWKLLTEEIDQELQTLQSELSQKTEIIRKKYLKPLGHYGSGLLVKQQKDFEGILKRSSPSRRKSGSTFRKYIPKHLKESQDLLVDFILERVYSRGIKLPEPQLVLFSKPSKSEQDREIVNQMVAKINWPTAEKIASKVQLQYSIDDLTIDHLKQENFVKAFKKTYGTDLNQAMRSQEIEIFG